MKVTIKNLGVNPLSTDLGLLEVGQERSFELDPHSMYKSAKNLKDLETTGKITLTVTEELALSDKLEPATLAGGVAVGAITTDMLSANAVTEAKLGANAVTEAKLGANAVSAAKAAVFVSAQQTGNGAAQNVAHGLGAVPSKVVIALTGGPAAYSQPVITAGAHDATNVVATVTTGWLYQVFAWK